MNSVRLRRELDVAAKQLPLNRLGIEVADPSPAAFDSLFVVVAVVVVAVLLLALVSWANEDDVDMELRDEVECDVAARAADDCGGVNVTGVGTGEPFVVAGVVAVVVVVVVVVELVSSCFMR